MVCLCKACPQRGTAFLHVFKAAGSSINKAMEIGSCTAALLCMSRWDFCYDTPATKGHDPTYHEQSEAVRDARATRGALLFSIVRDPATRFVSALGQLVRSQRVASNTTVSDLLGSVASRGFWDPHIWPQHYFLLNSNGTQLPVDFIGTTPDVGILQPFLLAEWTVLGGANHVAHPAVNTHDGPASPLMSWRTRGVLPAKGVPAATSTGSDSISDEETQRVCQLYRLDYELFGFEWPRVCARSVVMSHQQHQQHHGV